MPQSVSVRHKRMKIIGCMVHTFVLCAAAIAGQNGVDIAGRSLQEIAALGTEDERSNSRHIE